jgi:putative hemolysin
MKIQLVISLLLVVLLAGCAANSNAQDTGLPNPASAYCEEQGGTLEIREDGDGNQYGVCVFDDGSECEEWAFYRGNCEPGLGPLPPKDGEMDQGAPVFVDELRLNIMESFPVQVSATVRGNLADGCVVLDAIEAKREGDTFTLAFETHSEGDVCTQALVPFEESVSLDVAGLSAGTYTVVAGDVSETFTLDVDNVLDADND